MASSVANLKTVIGPGARASKYKVILTFPTDVVGASGDRADLLCKSASFPEITIGRIEVWTQGRRQVLPGDTDYDNNWSLTFYQEQAHQLRRSFLDWMEKIDHWQSNVHTGAPENYMVEAKILQMGSGDQNSYNDSGKPFATYVFHDLFPTSVGAVEVADDSINTLQEFTVTFAYTSWERVEKESEANVPRPAPGAK